MRTLIVFQAAIVCLAMIGCDGAFESTRVGGPTDTSEAQSRLLVDIVEVPSLSGVVTDVTGEPISDVVVFVQYCDETGIPGEHVYESLTDALGYYQIAGVPAGEWTVVAKKVEYKRVATLVVIPETGGVTLNFLLEPADQQGGGGGGHGPGGPH